MSRPPRRETVDPLAAGAPPTGSSPRVSVVVVNFNGRRHLEGCIPSVMATPEPGLELIVVDNASDDGSVEWLRRAHPAVRRLAMRRNLGFGAAVRRGAEHAAGEFLVILNNDVEVEEGWLPALLEPLEAGGDVAASCAVLRLMEHPQVFNARGGGMSRWGFGFDREFGFPYRPAAAGDGDEAIREVLFPTAAAMAMRRAEFFSCGGFDPSFFMYHEDVDLGWRLWLLGRRIVVCERAVVRHSFGGTTRAEQSLRWRERLGGRHCVRTLIKHYEPSNLLRALKGIVVLRLRQRAFGHLLHVALWNLPRLPGTLAARARVQRRRRRSDAELFDRALIGPEPYPAPHPALPRPRPEEAGRLQAPALFPGRDSALGRLGGGWYAPERREGEPLRATCGLAVGYLSAAPGSSGRLTAVVRAPAGLRRPGEVTLRAGGREARARPPAGEWTEIALEAAADDRGLLEVAVESPTWVPHRLTGGGDFRRLGVEVRELRFTPVRRTGRTVYRSASVVITTFNRWPILERTLEALRRQSLPGLELVVVDDGSTDGTWERLAAWCAERGESRVRVARQPNQGPAAARNRGLGLAREELVLFLGDDVIPHPQWAEAHVSRHNDLEDPVAVLGFTDWHREGMRVTPALELVNQEGQQFGYGWLRDGDDVPFTCFYTSNLSVPRRVLGERPFHPSFTIAGWEDTELGYRLSLAGLRIVYHRAALACHLHPTDFARFFARQRQVGRFRPLLTALHPELGASEALPPERPPRWFGAARPLMPVLVPLLSALDRSGLPVPRPVLRRVLLCGYYQGREEARRSPPPSAHS